MGTPFHYVPCIGHNDADTGVEVGELVHPTGEPLELELRGGLENLSQPSASKTKTNANGEILYAMSSLLLLLPLLLLLLSSH